MAGKTKDSNSKQESGTRSTPRRAKTDGDKLRAQSKDTGIPSTILRSDKHAQDTWKETHDNAVKEYGEGRRAHMVAYASLKHKYQKKGDRWVKKSESGPSDK